MPPHRLTGTSSVLDEVIQVLVVNKSIKNVE